MQHDERIFNRSLFVPPAFFNGKRMYFLRKLLNLLQNTSSPFFGFF
nr:MAG TPA: hypothetical protein [Caudoviricetes sp.]